MKEIAYTDNSFITAPLYMRSKQDFDEIINWCDFPETVSVVWINILQSWMSGKIGNSLFLDWVAWSEPELFRATFCLIDVYSGGIL